MREIVDLAAGRALDNGIDPETGEPFPEDKPKKGRPIGPGDFAQDGTFRPRKDGDS